jgi:hypothetical protein
MSNCRIGGAYPKVVAMTARTVIPAVALLVAFAAAPSAEAGKRCCSIKHSGNTATATGTILVPKTARILYVGMSPAVGTCASNPGPGKVAVSKKFNLRKTVRGYYRFIVVYMRDGDMHEKLSPRFFVRGKLKDKS